MLTTAAGIPQPLSYTPAIANKCIKQLHKALFDSCLFNV